MTITYSSPWGDAHVTHIAEGIARYETQNHGGYRLSVARLAQMPRALATILPFAGPGWYEEDCDFTIAVVSFPDYFTAAQLARAARSMRVFNDGRLTPAAAWLNTSPEAADVRERVATWERENAERFEWASMGSVPSRYTALERQLLPALHRERGPRAYFSFVTMRRVADSAEAHALLLPEEIRAGAPLDLSRVPAERIVLQPKALS